MGKKRRNKKNRKTFVFGFEGSQSNVKAKKRKSKPEDIFAIADHIFKGRYYSASETEEFREETIS